MSSPVVISILSDHRRAVAGITETRTAAQKIGDGFKSARGPALGVLAAIGAGAKVTGDAASDVSEELAKSGQIFGNQAAEIRKFASNAAETLGQSKQAALDATSTFGQIAQKAGLGGKASADFAKQFTTLASDLASFNNTTPEEAIDAIGAAMRGESEPLRRYGVLLDDATLRNRALKMGLIESTKQALSPQNKALAASGEIMAQTTKAQGDFARTSDGVANSARRNAAQTENLKASIGAGLLPAYSAIQGVILAVVNTLAKHETTTKVVVLAVAALAAGVLVVNGAMAVAGAATATYTAITNLHAAAQKRATAAALGTRLGMAALAVQAAVTSAVSKAAAAAQWALNVALSANPIGIVIALIVALVVGLVVAYKKSETFRTIVQAAFAAVRVAARVLWSALQTVFSAIGRVIGIVARLVVGYVRLYVAGFMLIVTAARTVARVVSDRIGAVVGYVRNLGTRVRSAASAAGTWLVSAGRSVIEGLVAGIKSAPRLIADAIGGVGDYIKSQIKSKFGINSPARLTRPDGASLVEGMATGVLGARPLLRRALDAVAGTVSGYNMPAVAAAVAGTGGTLQIEGGPRGSQPTIHVERVEVIVPDDLTRAEKGRRILDAIRAAGEVGFA